MLRVLIVGCGNIAGGFDADRATAQPPLTHAGAYTRHGGFDIVACVDPDANRRAAFMQRWGVAQGFDDIKAAAVAAPFDLISICSPTAVHASQIDAGAGPAPAPDLLRKARHAHAGADRGAGRTLRRCRRAAGRQPQPPLGR